MGLSVSSEQQEDMLPGLQALRALAQMLWLSQHCGAGVAATRELSPVGASPSACSGGLVSCGGAGEQPRCRWVCCPARASWGGAPRHAGGSLGRAHRPPRLEHGGLTGMGFWSKGAGKVTLDKESVTEAPAQPHPSLSQCREPGVWPGALPFRGWARSPLIPWGSAGLPVRGGGAGFREEGTEGPGEGGSVVFAFVKTACQVTGSFLPVVSPAHPSAQGPQLPVSPLTLGAGPPASPPHQGSREALRVSFLDSPALTRWQPDIATLPGL